MSCLKCGKCCKEVAFYINKENIDIEWIKLHGFEVENDGKRYKIKKQSTCKNLVNGKCVDYENRPEICKNYRCKENVFNDYPDLKN